MTTSLDRKNYFSTFIELLRYRALHQSDKIAYTFLQEGETESNRLTYQELDFQARTIAAKLQSLEATGERALLLYPAGLEVIAAFSGCLYAGVIAVPVPPPDGARLKRTLPRLQAVASDAQASIVLTTSRILSAVEELRLHFPELQAMRWLATEEIPAELAENWKDPGVNTDTLAYLQYTSGSTSTPKGVMVSHENLMCNSECINHALGYTSDSISATWMPYFHDYGLVDGLMQPLYAGIPSFVMSPLAFIKRPLRWLQAISRYKVTHTGGPNFAYEYCIRTSAPEQRTTLDLSSWRIASMGAEPIRKKTLEAFLEAFTPCGFRRSTLKPAYGLAETTLVVSFTKREADGPIFCDLLPAALEKNRAVEVANLEQGARVVVGCGQPVRGMKVVIADPQKLTQCAPDEVGEIWVSGRSVALGYWKQPEATEQTFRAFLAETGEGPFLRTGDLGFFKDGELFVTGRLKDLILIRGRNHYPQDIELTVEQSHPILVSGGSTAFSVDVAEEEQLVIVAEVERHYVPNIRQQIIELESLEEHPLGSDTQQDRDIHIDETFSVAISSIIAAIRKAVSEQHELQVQTVVLLKPGGIPKASSGKIQRRACRKGYLENSLSALYVWQSSTEVAVASLQESQRSSLQINGKMQKDLNAESQDNFACQSQPSTDEHVAVPMVHSTSHLLEWLRSYAETRINSRLIDERRCIPPYIVLDLGNRGILGMQVPSEYGGLGLNSYNTLKILEQLGAIDTTLASLVGVHNILGIRPILKYASKTVKDELLPILATGRELAAFALTEPGAGSNPQAISAKAIPDANGTWRLQGTKIWSGSAAWAGVINVFVKQMDSTGQTAGISGFTIRQGTRGLRQGPEALTMGMRGMVQNTVYLEDVPVSEQQLLGKVGAGMEVAQDAIMFGRLSLAATSVGGMKRVAQLMVRYAEHRSISTGRLLDNPVTLARLSDITTAITSVETLVTRIAHLRDSGYDVPVEAYTACKILATEFFWQAADSLVQMLGGRGYIETNIAPQILRDARILRIFEGPTETLNMFLGSCTITKSQELKKFIGETLASPEVYQHLHTAAEKIHDRCQFANPFPDSISASRWAYGLTGEVATWAILLAAVQDAFKRSHNELLRRALTWCQLHFEQKIERALGSTPADSVLLGADAVAQLVNDYQTAIGDVEQTLAGEDWERDELLRRKPSIANPQIQSNIMSITDSATETRKPIVTGSKQPRASGSPHTIDSIQKWIESWLVKKLKIDPKLIDFKKAFSDYGIDSVQAVQFSQDMKEWLGGSVKVDSTLVWNFSNIEAVTLYLSSELGDSEPVSPEKVEQSYYHKYEKNSRIEEMSEVDIAELLAEEIALSKKRNQRISES